MFGLPGWTDQLSRAIFNENSAALWKEEFKNGLFHFMHFKAGSSMDAPRLLKSVLARNWHAAACTREFCGLIAFSV